MANGDREIQIIQFEIRDVLDSSTLHFQLMSPKMMFNMVPNDKFNCYPHVIASWNLKVLYSAPGLWSERNGHTLTRADSAPSSKSITILLHCLEKIYFL